MRLAELGLKQTPVNSLTLQCYVGSLRALQQATLSFKLHNLHLLVQNSQLRLLKNEGLREYLGLNSVPLPHPVPKKAKRWEKVLPLGDNSPTSISSQVSPLTEPGKYASGLKDTLIATIT